ncbi:MAG TPA: hypothetical protein VMF30_06500 [Pirellulales bacterium]|nr:hypothetical protein [Pirellulales bacterium]
MFFNGLHLPIRFTQPWPVCMQFRQQRRRRLWTDEATRQGVDSEDSTASDAGSAGQQRETYTSHARREQQPRLTDLVPTRYRVLTGCYASGAVVIAALEGLYSRLDWFSAQLAPAVPRALDLTGRGSFAAWFSSAWLTITALVSILIYSLRRHRIDDLRARYRVWIWAALGWLALAVNQTAPWDELARAVVLRGGARIGLSASWLWPVVSSGLIAACAVRLSIEMRRSILSLVLFWAGGLAWLAGALTPALAGETVGPQSLAMLVAGLTLTGQWTILWSHLAYARHVLLDAHGLIEPRTSVARPRLARRTRKAAEKAEAASESSAHRGAAAQRREERETPAAQRAATSAASHAAPAPAKAAVAIKPAATPAAKSTAPAKPAAAAVRIGTDEEDDEDDDASDRGLSRAERKRLKRQQRGQMRNAA